MRATRQSLVAPPRKKAKKEEKLIRQQMASLLEDQEPVLQGPPFNQIIDLTKLSHENLIKKAKEVITPWNPEGHPPTSVSSPTMQSLIDGLEVTRESYSAIANPMRAQSPPSESSYNGSILSEDKDSIEKQLSPIMFSPKATAAKAVKKNKGTQGPIRLVRVNARQSTKKSTRRRNDAGQVEGISIVRSQASQDNRTFRRLRHWDKTDCLFGSWLTQANFDNQSGQADR